MNRRLLPEDNVSMAVLGLPCVQRGRDRCCSGCLKASCSSCCIFRCSKMCSRAGAPHISADRVSPSSCRLPMHICAQSNGNRPIRTHSSVKLRSVHVRLEVRRASERFSLHTKWPFPRANQGGAHRRAPIAAWTNKRCEVQRVSSLCSIVEAFRNRRQSPKQD